MLLLRTVLLALPDESKIAMEEGMSLWKERGRGGSLNLDGTTATAASEGDVSLPLGPGEWEEPLGMPLCVVCQNVSLPFISADPRGSNILVVREDGVFGKDAGLEGGGIRCGPPIHADDTAQA